MIDRLINEINKAIKAKGYLIVTFSIKGCPREEIIINHYENLDFKLDYYKKTYNDDGTHKFSNDVIIVGATAYPSDLELSYIKK